MKTLLKGGTLVLPDGEMQGDLLIENGKIAWIAPEISDDSAEMVDVSGCIVMPGAIDTHTHFALPVSGTVTADDFATGTRAAAIGGTTTVLDFATQDKGHTLHEAYETWRSRLDGVSSCDVGLHMAITDWHSDTAAEVAQMEAIGITSYKLYMAYDALMVEDDAIYEALRCIANVGGIAGFHCENGRLVDVLVAQEKKLGHMRPDAHPRSRPPQVEAEAVARLLRIADLAGAPVNIVHVSCAEALQAVRATRKEGQQVFMETCPQYLLLEDGLLAGEDGAKYVCSPPLRKQTDQRALWEALSGEEILTVGTDHCSFNYQGQKTMGADDFSKIPNGLPGVEHRLPLLMTEGVGTGRISVQQLVKLICENPAKLFGLYPQKGILAAGSDADIAVWDSSRPQTISALAQAQNVDYTPYEGFKASGMVRDVWLRGNRIVADGTFIRANQGQYVARKAPFSKKT